MNRVLKEVSQVSHLVHVENSSSKDEYDHHKDIPHTATGLGQKRLFVLPRQRQGF